MERVPPYGTTNGIESEPSFSRDGKLVVYSLAYKPDGKSAVWVSADGSQEVTRDDLTTIESETGINTGLCTTPPTLSATAPSTRLKSNRLTEWQEAKCVRGYYARAR